MTKVAELAKQAEEAYSTFHLRKASQIVMELAQLGNVYFDTKKPWVEARSALTHRDMLATIACCLEGLKTLALISFPILPQTAEKVWQMLGQQTSLATAHWEEALHTPLPEGRALQT